jgi:hypothetical protein
MTRFGEAFSLAMAVVGVFLLGVLRGYCKASR